MHDADQIEIGGNAVEVAGQRQVAMATPDVGRLMELALEQGADGVESLERLVALQERMMTIQAEQAMNAALAEFHRRLTPIPKTSVVDYVTKGGAKVKYSFAKLDTIATHIRPLLAECGLSYSWNERPSPDGDVEYECIIHHELGAKRPASTRLPKGSGANPQMNDAQRAIATQSYGRRAALIMALGLTTADDDVDGMVASSEPISEEQKAQLVQLLHEIDASPKWITWWLKKLGVDVIQELPATRFDVALAELQAKKESA